MDDIDPADWQILLTAQAGAVSRAQVLARGVTDHAIAAHVAAHRWQHWHPGVYFTFTGPPSPPARRWAALLHCGPGSALSHDTAGALWGLVDDNPVAPVHVTSARSRSIRPRQGVRLHRPRRAVRPVGVPPRTSAEVTVVDLAAHSYRVDAALALVARACQRRIVHPSDVAAEVRLRPRQRWRRALLSALGDVESGAHSILELRYLRDVERPHGLPPAQRQRAVSGTRQDVHYDGFQTTVELDGRLGHADTAGAWRDMARDNAATLRGETTLRFGWTDVTSQPCEVAAQVTAVLRTAGWAGPPTACGNACPTPRLWATSSRL